MKISYFPKQMALKSEPIWHSFLKSCQKYGLTPIENSLDADCLLIWSVLWHGRLEANRKIYEYYRSLNKPVFICEVGSLIRGKTWKVALNNINKNGIYANDFNFILNRDKKLGIKLIKISNFQNKPILIAGQHDKSLQWDLDTDIIGWVESTIKEIRKYSLNSIIVRPHPRNLFRKDFGSNIHIENPTKILGTYDQYDLDPNYSLVVNYNSGVGIWSGVNGIPIICDDSSLSSDISIKFHEICQPQLPDREEWFKKILHTEWLIEEIESGIPLKRLMEQIDLTL